MIKKISLFAAFCFYLSSTNIFAMDGNFADGNFTDDNATEPVGYRNWDYYLSFPACPSDDQDCYNFFYRAGDGLFATYPNFIAALNVFALVYNIGSYSVGSRKLAEWSRKNQEYVDDKLLDLKNLDLKLRDQVARIVVDFDNGISGDDGRMYAEKIVRDLKDRQCNNCIAQFVDIVSKNISTDDASAKAVNFAAFKKFCDGLHEKRYVKHKCADHDFEQIAPVMCVKEKAIDDGEESYCQRIKTALFEKWNHASHWSSWTYAAGVFGAIFPMSYALDVTNRAGSFFGDMANNTNMIVIPTVYWFSIFQQYMNLDRAKAKLLEKQFIELINEHSVYIEISARAIGKMQNGISYEEARGFIEMLILFGWPDELVKDFEKVASTVLVDVNDKRNFKDRLNKPAKEPIISFEDEFVRAAMDENSNIKIVVDGKKPVHEKEDLIISSGDDD